MAFVIVPETILISMVSSTLSISKLTSTIIIPMIIWHGPRYGCGHSMGVCLICLAWAALRLRPPCGLVLTMFGMGRPMVTCGTHHRRIRNRKCKRKPTSKSEDEIRNEGRAIRAMAPIYNNNAHTAQKTPDLRENRSRGINCFGQCRRTGKPDRTTTST